MRLYSKSVISLLTAAVVAVSPMAVITAEASSSLGQQYNSISNLYGSLLGGSQVSGSSSKTNNTSSSASGPASSGTGTYTGSQNGVIVENRSSQTTLSSGSSTVTSGSTDLPTRQTVTLSENYYEDYDIYEEGINGLFYFYSNISNGGVTNKSVYVDFPANITYTAELDGQQFAYTSKQVLSTKGTYVFRIKAIYTPDTALSQQCEYQTTFRFRIQDKVVKETEAAAQAADNGSVYAWGSSGSTGSSTNSSSQASSLIDNAVDIAQALSSRSLSVDYITKSISSGAVSIDQMADMLGATPEALKSFLELTKDESETESESAADESQSEENADEEDAKSEETDKTVLTDDDAMVAAAAAGRGTGSGIVESIDDLTGQYLETLLTGTSFVASVQNGATVNGTVSFSFPSENTLVVEATRNGKPYEYTVGSDFTESGWYCLDIRDTIAGYEETYNGKEKPKFYFQIINNPVKDLDILFVPQGEAVSSFTWDGREQKDNSTWVSFPYDGTYVLTYTTASGKNTTVTINKDTRAPKLSVTAKNGHAQITANETLAQITVYKNGEQIEYSGEEQIKGAGKYEVHASDAAGNTAAVSFKLGAGISASTVIAILLILVLIGGAIGYVIHIKKNTSMR